MGACYEDRNLRRGQYVATSKEWFDDHMPCIRIKFYKTGQFHPCDCQALSSDYGI